MENRKNRHYRKNYKAKKEEPVKLYEIDILLSRDGKSYKAYAPACASGDVMNALERIVRYIKTYGEIGFNVYSEPVV